MPAHLTAATFFVRLFQTATGAAAQVAVTTMGPPMVTAERLYRRLAKHQAEMSGQAVLPENLASATRAHLPSSERQGLLELDIVQAFGKSSPEFQRNIDGELDELAELDFAQELKRGGDYQKKFSEVVSQSNVWPGRFFASQPPLRERRSLSFTSDFFGRPESVSSVRAIYERISKSILDTLNETGFDISAYRGSDGKYLINADKIEQLIVGEHVSVAQAGKAQEASMAPGDTGAAGGSTSRQAGVETGTVLAK